MRPIPPANLVRHLTRAQARSVVVWWRGLERPARHTLRSLFDELAPAAAPGVVVRLVSPPERLEPAEDFPEIDLYEYIVNHELVFAGLPVFHICAAHEAARATLRVGSIPAAFTCPVARRDCPMRALVAPAGGRDVQLVLVRRRAGTGGRGRVAA